MKDGGLFDAAKTTTAEFLTFDGLFVQASVMKKNGAFWLRIEATGDKSDEITARTRGWIYKISNYTASTLTKRLADMVEDAKPKS